MITNAQREQIASLRKVAKAMHDSGWDITAAHCLLNEALDNGLAADKISNLLERATAALASATKMPATADERRIKIAIGHRQRAIDTKLAEITELRKEIAALENPPFARGDLVQIAHQLAGTTIGGTVLTEEHTRIVYRVSTIDAAKCWINKLDGKLGWANFPIEHLRKAEENVPDRPFH